jgi:hypothetical protein
MSVLKICLLVPERGPRPGPDQHEGAPLLRERILVNSQMHDRPLRAKRVSIPTM